LGKTDYLTKKNIQKKKSRGKIITSTSSREVK
jgi:hypothetical protein